MKSKWSQEKTAENKAFKGGVVSSAAIREGDKKKKGGGKRTLFAVWCPTKFSEESGQNSKDPGAKLGKHDNYACHVPIPFTIEFVIVNENHACRSTMPSYVVDKYKHSSKIDNSHE